MIIAAIAIVFIMIMRFMNSSVVNGVEWRATKTESGQKKAVSPPAGWVLNKVLRTAPGNLNRGGGGGELLINRAYQI